MSTQHSERRSGTHGSERALSRGFIYLAAGLTLGLAVVLFAMAATEWREFRIPANGYDLAFLNQGFYLALHGHGWFHSTLDQNTGHGSILGAHFSPSFYVFLPFYAIWQSPLLLLLLASLGVATAGTGVFLTARRIFGSTVVALVWFALFALYPPIPWSVDNGFREVFLAMGFLSFALLYYMKGEYRVFFVVLVLALLSKEDIALLLPIWGGVAWLQGRGRRLAGSMALLGVTYFLAANAIVLPLLRGHHPGLLHFEAFGSPSDDNLTDILHSIRSVPGEIAHLVLSRQNLGYWAAIFSPLLFLSVLGWEYVVIPAYVYAEISLSPMMQQVPLRHIFPALPFIFVAAMVGTVRLVKCIERMSQVPPAHAVAVRNVSLAALLCGVVGSTAYSTPFPALLRVNWPTEAGLRRDAALFQALAHIPPWASLAATGSLIAESSSRERLYYFQPDGAYSQDVLSRQPNYIAIDLVDLDASPQARRWVAAALCQGVHGVVYEDRRGSERLLMEWGADLSANQGVYEALFPGPRQECRWPVQEPMDPRIFFRVARAHVRTQVPSEVRAWDMFVEPVYAQSAQRFSQVIHLPDHTFEPGWYRLDLTGAWPWLGVPASYRVTARVLFGELTVGEVAAGGDQPLNYTTPPLRIDARGTLPILVQMEVQTSGESPGPIVALRPTREACAVVADAPSLNPQQVTVEAWVYPEGMVQHPGTEYEAPILSKGNALGYYLRLSGDDQGKAWVDFHTAGKWAAGRVGTVPVRRWTAIAATYDGQEVRIYVNGHQAPHDPVRGSKYAGLMQNRRAPLVIGCRDPGTPSAVVFPGLIASARVWSRVLTPHEIQEDAVTWSVPTKGQKGLVGSWDFRDLREGIVPDLSAVGNPVTNGAGLTRVPVPDVEQPFSLWRSRHLNLVRLVTVRPVAP